MSETPQIELRAVVLAVARPECTRATLASLGRTEGVQAITIDVLSGSGDEQYDKQLAQWCLDYLPGRSTVHVRGKTPWVSMFQEAVGIWRTHLDSRPLLAWIENDNLFNPPWFIGCQALIEQAERDGHRVGICAPHHILGPYDAVDPSPEAAYYIKKRLPGPAWLLTADACAEIPADPAFYDQKAMDHKICEHLRKRGFTHLCPKISVAQHIGITGFTTDQARWEQKGYGGVGFEPAAEIADLVPPWLPKPTKDAEEPDAPSSTNHRDPA